MKKAGFLVVAFATVFLTSSAMAWPRKAACVGGPRGAAYAFNSWADAQRCAQVVGSQSRDCARFVRTGRCRTENYNVDTVNPNYCVCNGGGPNIGYWD